MFGTVFGNISLINEISDHYADYKTEKITKGQYDARRKKALDQLTKNIGPMKKLLFGQHTPHNVIRIARAGGIPATAHITQQTETLGRNSSLLRRFATRPDTKGNVLSKTQSPSCVILTCLQQRR